MVVSAGVTMAVSVPVLSESAKRRMVRLPRSNVIPVSATVTVTSQLAEKPPSAVVTVTVVVPPFFAVTRPFSSTEAMLASLLDQTTFWFVAVAGVTVAVSCAVPFFSMVTLAVSRETPVTAMGFAVTAHSAYLPLPSFAVAVMTAVPLSTSAVTTPFSSTVATVSSLLVQVTALLSALAGDTVATSVALVFFTSSSEVLLNETLVASTTTVTVHCTVFPSAEAVMTALPPSTAVSVIVPVFVDSVVE